MSYSSIAEKIIHQKKSMDGEAIDLVKLESMRDCQVYLPEQINKLTKNIIVFI